MRARLAAVALAAVVLLLSSGSARADSYYPGGSFDSDASGWYTSGNASNCFWDGSVGFPSPGSIRLAVADCNWYSPTIVIRGSGNLSVTFQESIPTGADLHFWLYINGSIADYADQSDCPTWCTFNTGYFPIGDGMAVELVYSAGGSGGINVDSVTYALNTPLPTATPTAAAISGNSAIGLITVSPSTPGYDSSGTPVAMPYHPSASSDWSAMVRIHSVSETWSFCLPSQITQVFTDLNLCWALSVVRFPQFVWMGVDFFPYMAFLSSVVLLAFMLRQLQER